MRPQMRLRDLPDETNAVSSEILGAAIEVQSTVGWGFLESTYRDCLAHELRLRGHEVLVEEPLPLRYKDLIVPDAYRADLIVAGRVVVELKATDRLGPEHEAQVLSYLRATGCRLGMLLNFGAPRIRDGFVRLVL